MKIKGTPASPGIAIGRAYLMSEEDYCVIKRSVEDNAIKKEINRFKRAIAKAEQEFRKQREKVAGEMGKKYAHLWDAYMLILKDPLLYKDTIKIINDEKVNVEYALQQVIHKITKVFSLLDDEYMRDRVRDVQDVGSRIMSSLLGQERVSLKEIQTRVVVVAHTLNPSDIVDVDHDHLIGILTDVGGQTSHIVILAESLAIPAVVGLKHITREVSPGDLLVIDGNSGIVYINPEPEVVRAYRKKKRDLDADKKKLIEMRDLPAVTLCGEEIHLAANIETEAESNSLAHYGAKGVGLYRTEYFYLNRYSLPNEFEIYKSVMTLSENIYPDPLVIRTVDLGADKVAGPLGLEIEKDTFMGMRGIRLCLAYPGLFKTQLRAVLKASVKGNISIMYPMISTLKEIKSANYILNEVKDELATEGFAYDNNMKVGLMIETPSAALDVKNLLKEVDFISIGTNDLIQYMLAVDRISETVSYLYNPADISIINILDFIIRSANEAGKNVSMCGEMASDTLYTELLLGMGLRNFSMSGIAIPKIKQIIRSTTIEKCIALREEVLAAEDTSRIISILKHSRDTHKT